MAPVDDQGGPAATGTNGAELSPGELVEKVANRAVTGLVLAAAILGLAVYSRPGPARYQAVAGDGQVVRLDTRTGTMIGCDSQRCLFLLRRGQHLERRPNPKLPKPVAAPPQAPAPSIAPPPAKGG